MIANITGFNKVDKGKVDICKADVKKAGINKVESDTLKITLNQIVAFLLMFCLLAMITSCGKANDSAATENLPVDNTITIYSSFQSQATQFSVEQIKQALKETPFKVEPLKNWNGNNTAQSIVLFPSSNEVLSKEMEKSINRPLAELIAEGFQLENNNSTIWIRGNLIGGVMYGGLELAEQIRISGLSNVTETVQNPYMEKRGTKFNIPLDARTPSYTDMGDAGQKNIPEMWNLKFWQQYLDNLATHRYNFVSLWNLHPFPSMVKVPDYPDIALDQVHRSTTNWQEYYSLQGKNFDSPEILNNVEIISEFTIDDKIAFWRKVMEYAKDRNIVFYVVTWNIFINGTEGKYGITDDINNETTIDYFRKSIKQMFVTYPLLAGMGLTTGENMPEASFLEKEDWAYKAYGMGVLDAAKQFPNRKITFIHRQHQAGAQDIAKRFNSLLDQSNIDFIFSFKYAQAHVYSSTKQHFHGNFLGDIGDMKTIWTLRNDDVYLYRWGAPNFVREFIQNIPYEVGRGYYYGSDQYIWGREFLSLDPETPRELELDKHWYQWMLWGRLGYNPKLSNERITGILVEHFDSQLTPTNANTLMEAWQHASMIYPIVTGFHWGEYDFQWYIEACKSRPGPAQTESGFHDVNRFISLPPHKSTNYQSIPEFVKKIATGKTSPNDVAEQIHKHADTALTMLLSLEKDIAIKNIAAKNRELSLTLKDIRTIALLGKYYAHKIQGATQLALYRESQQVNHKILSHKKSAIEHLTKAATYWQQYVQGSSERYASPLWFNRVGYVDWKMLSNEVLNDIKIAENE